MHESICISHCVGMYLSPLAFNYAGDEVMDLTGVSCGLAVPVAVPQLVEYLQSKHCQ